MIGTGGLPPQRPGSVAGDPRTAEGPASLCSPRWLDSVRIPQCQIPVTRRKHFRIQPAAAPPINEPNADGRARISQAATCLWQNAAMHYDDIPTYAVWEKDTTPPPVPP